MRRQYQRHVVLAVLRFVGIDQSQPTGAVEYRRAQVVVEIHRNRLCPFAITPAAATAKIEIVGRHALDSQRAAQHVDVVRAKAPGELGVGPQDFIEPGGQFLVQMQPVRCRLFVGNVDSALGHRFAEQRQ